MKKIVLILFAAMISLPATNAFACGPNATGTINEPKYDVANLLDNPAPVKSKKLTRTVTTTRTRK